MPPAEIKRKASVLRKSSVHKNFVFTVEGAAVSGWETDLVPHKKRFTDDLRDSFIKKKLGASPAGSAPQSSSGCRTGRRSRLLLKLGRYNILGKNIPQRRERYFTDFWNTLIDLRWGYLLTFFLFSLIFTWLLFGLLFWLIALIHGDSDDIKDPSFVPCLVNVPTFAAAFLFSIETMHTIGYGFRYPTDECVVNIIAMYLAVRAHLVHHRMTQEGELMPFHQHELAIQLDSMSGNAFSRWPVTACHYITPGSPLYELTKKSLERAKFEIIVALEGIAENTGVTLQARTSFTPDEIIWGHSFTRLLTFRKEKGEYVVDFNHFESLEPVKGMIGLSARELDENKSLSAPEGGGYGSDYDPPSPSLSRAITASDNLASVDHRCGHDGSHICQHTLSRRNSQAVVDPEYIKQIFRPPSPSLARAVSTHTMESMSAMARDYENNVRRFSGMSVDSGSYSHQIPRMPTFDHYHRPGSPGVFKRSHVVDFHVEPIEENEDEVTKF